MGDVVFQNDVHPGSVLENLNKLRTFGSLCDVRFVCEGCPAPINGHKAVLSACSRYFLNMFSTGMVESSATDIPIKGVDWRSFEQLIDYCYTATLTITTENVRPLLSAACLFDFHEISRACEEYLSARITISNCIPVALFATIHSCEELLEGAESFTRAHFIEITKGADFLSLDCQHLIRLISHDQLSVSSEIEVFNAVISWLEHDLEKRREDLPEILEHIRFGVMSPKLLLDCVVTNPHVSSHPKCKAILDGVTAYHLLPERRCEMTTVSSKARTSLPRYLYAVGGENNVGIKLASVERYNVDQATWEAVAPMNIGRSSVGLTSCNGLLYCGGGFGSKAFLNNVERYSPYENEWREVAALDCARSCLGMVCLDDFVYAIGGRRDDARLSSVERYDCHRDTWVPAGNMTQSRSAAGCTVVDGCIYVAGGYDGFTDLNTVERYDPRGGKWCQVAAMKKKRSLTAAVTLNGCIYVPGGQILMTLLDSVECYDPRNNTWTPMSPLLSSRYGCGAAVLGQSMFVAGGCDGGHRLASLERYDPVRNVWSAVHPMADQRYSLGVCAL